MTDKNNGWLERTFESFLLKSRYVTILAVLTSLVAALLLFVMATGDVLALAVKAAGFYFSGGDYGEFHTKVIERVIAAVDDYLLATVLLIFALGLYELFISKIDAPGGDEARESILVVKSLDDLKDRLGKVVLMILIVTFFKSVNKVAFDEPLQILYLGAGILFVALALYFTHAGGKGKDGH